MIAAVVALSVILFWSYWPTFVEMAGRWEIDPQYSHGYLVPLFALALLVIRLKQADLGKLQPRLGLLNVGEEENKGKQIIHYQNLRRR